MQNSIIIAENISFSYGNRRILEDLTFRIEKGEKIGVVGESGCGKSTLLRLLAGLLPNQEGKLTVCGETSPEKIIRKISMVMQEPQLLPLTIYENITLGHELPTSRLEEILEASQLKKWISTLEKGVDTYLGNNANELSGGQAQRIAIARAMAKNADIILLDEPTSSLDSNTGRELMGALSGLTEGKTVIHVTHQPELLRGYNRIFTLEKGHIAWERRQP